MAITGKFIEYMNAKKAANTVNNNTTTDQQLKNDATGTYSTVSAPYVKDYLNNGYAQANSPVDYSKLSSNSAYRQENAPNVQNAFVPPAQIINAPKGYTPPIGSTIVPTISPMAAATPERDYIQELSCKVDPDYHPDLKEVDSGVLDEVIL